MDPKTPNISNTGASQTTTGQSLSQQKTNIGTSQAINRGTTERGTTEDAASLSGTINPGTQTGGYGRNKTD